MIAITMIRNGRELSKYARSQTMTDVLDYVRGFVAPAVASGGLVAVVQQPGQAEQRFAVRFNAKRVTLVRE